MRISCLTEDFIGEDENVREERRHEITKAFINFKIYSSTFVTN